MLRNCFLRSTIYLVFVVAGCNSDYDRSESPSGNGDASLRLQIDSLEIENAELKKSPAELFQQVREEVKTNDLSSTRKTFELLKSRQFNSKQIGDINNLCFIINKAEREDKQFNEDGGEDELTGKTKSNQQHIHLSKKQVSHYSAHTERIAAICCDGSRSYATGRGACSHHGGVCQWLYQ